MGYPKRIKKVIDWAWDFAGLSQRIGKSKFEWADGKFLKGAGPGADPAEVDAPAGGVTDHGALDGLADDDHGQYLNEARHDLVARHPLAVLDTLVCSQAEADSKINTHKGDASAHHDKGIANSKVKVETRDMTADTGDVSYTGVGFKPTCIICLAAKDMAEMASWGLGDSNKGNMNIRYQAEHGYGRTTSYLISLQENAFKSQNAVIKSYDADGFTLTWTKAGTPSAATPRLFFLCLR